MSYRDINRGPQLAADYAIYQTWLRQTSAQKQASYRTSRVGTRITYAKQVLWVAPFTQGAKNLYVEVKGPAVGAASPGPTLLTLLAGYFGAQAPAAPTDTILSPELFPINKLAKMVAKVRVTTATTESRSRITNREYKHHETNSISMCFGKNVASDNFSSVVRDVKNDAAYRAFITPIGNSISFIPEG